MATKEEYKIFADAMEWDNAKVCKWLADSGLEEVQGSFEKEKIVGKDLPLLSKADFRDMGLPVGSRLRLVKLLQKFKVGYMIATKNQQMWKGVEWYICPLCVFFKRRYTLTKSSLTVYKAECCKKNYDRVDITSVVDINQQQFCLHGEVTVHTNEKCGIIRIRTARDKTEEVYKAISSVKELDQMAMAGRR